MKIATLVTLVVAAVLFATMAQVQRQLELKDFRFGFKWSYSEEKLEQNVINKEQKARLVVVPLLFPLDFLFLIFLGLFLALCSITYADGLGVPSAWTWALLVLPVTYMVADFSKNALYSPMLLWSDSIAKLIDAAHWATRVKLVAGGLAILQAVVAFLRSHG
jgi:uncharacterized membrane protein YccF (DUF307 family)